MYLGPDGKLYQQINRTDPNQNRLQHILEGGGLSGRSSPNYSGKASPQRSPRHPQGFGFGGAVSTNHGNAGGRDFMY